MPARKHGRRMPASWWKQRPSGCLVVLMMVAAVLTGGITACAALVERGEQEPNAALSRARGDG